MAGDTDAALAASLTDQPWSSTRSTSTLRPYGQSFALRWPTRASFRSGVRSTPNRDGRLSPSQQPWWELQLARQVEDLITEVRLELAQEAVDQAEQAAWEERMRINTVLDPVPIRVAARMRPVTS